MVTLAPSAAIARATAKPIPEVEPVTSDNELGRLTVEPERFAELPHSTYDGDLLGAPGEDATFPRAIDLSALFPTPGDQGNLSSCVGWSTAMTTVQRHCTEIYQKRMLSDGAAEHCTTRRP